MASLQVIKTKISNLCSIRKPCQRLNDWSNSELRQLRRLLCVSLILCFVLNRSVTRGVSPSLHVNINFLQNLLSFPSLLYRFLLPDVSPSHLWIVFLCSLLLVFLPLNSLEHKGNHFLISLHISCLHFETSPLFLPYTKQGLFFFSPYFSSPPPPSSLCPPSSSACHT